MSEFIQINGRIIMTITKNVGRIEQIIRIIAGIILLSLVSMAFIGPQTIWAYLGLIGLIPLITGIIGYCPPYQLLGINTNKNKHLKIMLSFNQNIRS
jgi:hypothetical protein